MNRLPGAIYSRHGELLLSLGQHTDPESIDVSVVSRTTQSARDDESREPRACVGDCVNDATGQDGLCDSCRADAPAPCECCGNVQDGEPLAIGSKTYCAKCAREIVMTYAVIRAAQGFFPRKCAVPVIETVGEAVAS